MAQQGEPTTEITVSDQVSTGDPDGLAPTNIIKVGDPFTVWIEFDLTGQIFRGFAGILRYTVRYWVTGLGNPAPASPIPPLSRQTTAGKFSYVQPDTQRNVAPNTLAAGLYQLGAAVTFTADINGVASRVNLTAFTLPKIIEIY